MKETEVLYNGRKTKNDHQSAEKSSNIYPKRLRSLSSMPDMLYYIGRLPDDDRANSCHCGGQDVQPYGGFRHFNMEVFK